MDPDDDDQAAFAQVRDGTPVATIIRPTYDQET